MNRRPNIITINNVRYFQKHTATQRLQTIIQIMSVTMLGLTGLPLRYSENEISRTIYDFFGGAYVVPNLHRAAGVVLLSVFVYHTLYWMRLFYISSIKRMVREKRLSIKNIIIEFFSQTMILNKKDFGDIWDHFKYITYQSAKPAQYARIMWKEKFEYYAQYWGITVIGLAGLALWWRDEVTQVLPGIVLNAAYLMHSYEALLAVLFLLFIHWYHEFYCPEKFPIPTGFFSGYIVEKQIIHEHYSHYVQLMVEAGLEDEIKPLH